MAATQGDAEAWGGAHRRAPAAVLWLALGLTVGCGRAEEGPPSLAVTRFRQAGLGRVFLNEALVVHLDGELDPASVHRESARVIDADGRRVEGRWEVERDRLRFVPRLPRQASLDDGSFRPGGRYAVELRGFPLPDGLRSLDGRPLVGPWRGEFATADDDPYFDDPTLGTAAPLGLAAVTLGPGGPVRLRCAEPLDPRSVAAARFSLRRLTSVPPGDGGGGAEGGGAAEPGRPTLEEVALFAELVRNGPDGAELELWPVIEPEDPGVRRLLAPGDVHLWLAPDGALPLDLGGNRVPLAWRTAIDTVGDLQVVGREAGDAPKSRLFEFLAPTGRSPEDPTDADGTAWWGDGGAVTVRLPAAVGDGSDGRLEWRGLVEGPAIVRATELTVAPGAEVALPAEGLVVLRAQGRLSIDGRMLRRTLPAERSWRPDESSRQWWQRFQREGGADRTPPVGFRQSERLSDWLARAEDADPAWTVLVAGGDLVIEGELRCDGPLVLVAGGRVRARGPVSATEIWQSDLGGGTAMFPQPQVLPLEIDPPTVNPLRETLRLRVLSDPFRPPEGDAVRWLPARVVLDPGDGQARVRFLGRRPGPDGRWESVGPVDDPLVLTDSPTVRLSLELELGPTDPARGWRPPRIDAVELFWERRERRP